MDQYPPVPTQQSPTPNDTGNKLRGLAFLKVGLFEVGFVVIVLLLLFGILNYFNILSISDVFPNQLSWLPRQQIQKKITTPSSTKFTPDTFQYDTKKAETLLIQYIKDTIKPEFLPSKIEVKQGLSIDGRTENINYEFGSIFTIKESSISANFHFKENANFPNDYAIFIQPNNVIEATATTSLANSLLSSYFTNPYTISSCQTKGTNSYCENFQTLNGEKRGYGIIFGHEGSKLMRIAFTCLIPKDSKNFTLSSCISP